MARDQRDIVPVAFTVTNSEVISSFDADTSTATIQNNAIAFLFQTLLDQGILTGSVS